MNTDGPFHFAPTTKQAAQGQMRLYGFTVHFQQLHKHVDGLVRLFIQQVIQSAKVGGCGKTIGVFAAFGHMALCRPPTGSGSNRQ